MPTDIMTWFTPTNLVLFVIIFTRLSGLIASAPLFSTYPIPAHAKAWFVATVTFVIFPFILATSNFVMPNSIPALSVILMKEFMIGYIVGFLVNIIFVGVEIGANVVSVQMSLAMAQALNPATGQNSPVLAQAYVYIMALVFLATNSHHFLFNAIYKSFSSVPIGYGFIMNGQLAHEVVYLSGQMFVVAFGLALPIFAVLFMTDVLLGFTAKMMPQMNIFMVAIPLKVYLGLLTVLLLIRPAVEYISRVLSQFLQGIMTLF